MKTFTILLTDPQIDQLINTFAKDKVSPLPPYTLFQCKLEGCTITIYTSKKAVFQGENASFFADTFQKKSPSSPYTHAGSDEVGTGDYFGPVCVCACIVKKDVISELEQLKVQDSKAMTDKRILEIGEKIMELCPHSLLVLENEKYNSISPTNNMNMIKAKLHNQAYLHLSKKEPLPELSVIDQFTPETLYYRYLQQEPHIIKNLHFETKAESKYLAVACASIIARYAFLKSWKNLEEHYNYSLLKGAGIAVDENAADFVQQFGWDELKKVAKLHFKNTEKLKSYL